MIQNKYRGGALEDFPSVIHDLGVPLRGGSFNDFRVNYHPSVFSIDTGVEPGTLEVLTDTIFPACSTSQIPYFLEPM